MLDSLCMKAKDLYKVKAAQYYSLDKLIAS